MPQLTVLEMLEQGCDLAHINSTRIEGWPQGYPGQGSAPVIRAGQVRDGELVAYRFFPMSELGLQTALGYCYVLVRHRHDETSMPRRT